MPGLDAIQPEPALADRSTGTARAIPEAAAVRDAHEIAARVAEDEEAADAERSRLLREPLPQLELPPDPSLQLAPGERLHAVRRAALLEHGRSELPVGGTLYLTSARMLHIGAGGIVDAPLSSMTDIAVALERILLVGLADGSGLAIEVDQPRLLRVQVAAARAIAREPRR
jgi:hypothetical protein